MEGIYTMPDVCLEGIAALDRLTEQMRISNQINVASLLAKQQDGMKQRDFTDFLWATFSETCKGD